uniref:DNA-directed RNA polymerase III subunit RPC7 n=1 Tax=Leptobrachium leishanense TaxID=445787 RepID=A0A8C5LXR6_9ANUR
MNFSPAIYRIHVLPKGNHTNLLRHPSCNLWILHTADMAGKGRGRGASFTFDLQAIGFSKGDSLPETQWQPKAVFPALEFRPVPLREGDDLDYILALKREIRGSMQRRPHYIGEDHDNKSVEKYSAKYKLEAEKKLQKEWTPDWRLLPKEMKAVKKRTVKKPKKVQEKQILNKEDVLKKIEELEKKGDGEASEEETEGKKKGGEEEEEEEEVELEDEEELEEENDYIASYFEDGDDIGGSDDNMDEATY